MDFETVFFTLVPRLDKNSEKLFFNLSFPNDHQEDVSIKNNDRQEDVSIKNKDRQEDVNIYPNDR